MDVGKVNTKKVQTQNLQNAQVIEKKRGMSEKELSIFDKLDLDKNGVIDEEELKALVDADQNQNGKLTSKEVKKFAKAHNLNLKNKDVIEFLNRYGIKAEDIESAVTTGEGENKSVTINYADGQGSKTISADGTYVTNKTDGENNDVTTSYTKDGVRTQETVVSSDQKLTTETDYEQDGTTPAKRVETTKNDEGETATVSTTTFKDGKMTQNVTDDKTQQTVTTTDYTLNGEGNEIKSQEVIVSSNPENTYEQTTTFENGIQRQQVTHNETKHYDETINYNANGTQAQKITHNTSDKPYDETVNFDAEGNQTNRTLTQGPVTSNYVIYNNTEYLIHKEEIVGTDAVRNYDYQYTEEGRFETITEPNGKDKTVNVTNPEGKNISQTKVINGKRVATYYDENGNTIGFERNGQQIPVAFQYGMTLQQFCQKFGCSVAEFKAANGGKTKFTPGDAVKIPKEIAADDKRLLSLKTPQEAREQYIREQQMAQAKKQLYPYGIQNTNNYGTKIKVNGKLCTIIGDGMFGTQIVTDSKNQAIVINKKTHKPVEMGTYMNRVTYARGKKITLSEYDGGTRTGNGMTVVVKGPRYVQGSNGRPLKDPNGRFIGILADGSEVVISGAVKLPNGQTVGQVKGNNYSGISQRVALNERYVADSDDADRGIIFRPSYSDKTVSYGKNGFAFKGVIPQDDKRRIDANGNYIELMAPTGGSVDATTMYRQDANAIVLDLKKDDKKLSLNAIDGIANPAIMAMIDNQIDVHAILSSTFSDQEAYAIEGNKLVATGLIQNQSRRDNIIAQNITTYGDDIENLEAGYRSIQTDADKQGAITAAQNYITTNNVETPHGYKGLSALDILTYHQTEGDSKEVRVANNALYINKQIGLFTYDEYLTSRGAEVSYFLEDDDINNALIMADEHQLAKADQLRKEAGEPTIHDIIAPSPDNIHQMGKVIATGYIPYSDAELAIVALSYVNSYADHGYDARLRSSQQKALQGILRTPGAVNTFNKFLNGDLPLVDGFESAEKLKKQAKCMGYSVDNLSLISREARETFQFISDEEKDQFYMQIAQVRAMADQLQMDWDRVLNDEGYLDAFINEFRQAGLGGGGTLGVTRAQILSQLQDFRELVNEMQLASEGRIYKADGSEKTFESLLDIFNQSYMNSTYTTNVNGKEEVRQIQGAYEGIYTKMDQYQSDQETGHIAFDIAVTFVPMFKAISVAGKSAKLINTAFKFGKIGSATTRITLAGTFSGIATGGAQYSLDRFNHLSSVTGNNIQTRMEDKDKAVGVGVMTGASVMVGMGVGEATGAFIAKGSSRVAQAEERLQMAIARAERVEGATRAVEISEKARRGAVIIEKACKDAGVSLDIGLNVLSDHILTQVIFDREMTEQEMILSLAGNILGAVQGMRAHENAGASHSGSGVHTPRENTLDKAVKSGSSGGAFSPENYQQAVIEISTELRHGAAPKRAADLYMEAATHGAQSHTQGRGLQHTVAENSGFTIQNGRRVATTPEGQAVVTEINQQVAQRAEAILRRESGGHLTPSEATMLNDHITHNLNTPEDLIKFKQELAARFEGRHAQVQGVDQVDRVMQFADKKLNALNAQKASVTEAIGMMIPGGMDAKALATAKGVMENPATTLQDLQALRDAVAKTKKFGGQQKLLKDMDARIAEMKKNAPETEPITPQGTAKKADATTPKDDKVKAADTDADATPPQKNDADGAGAVGKPLDDTPVSLGEGNPIRQGEGNPVRQDEGNPIRQDEGNPIRQDEGNPIRQDEGNPIRQGEGNSAKPNEGINPAKPNEGVNPAKPNEGINPAKPNGGANPAKPNEGINPAKPNEGINPAKPNGGANPAKPKADGAKPLGNKPILYTAGCKPGTKMRKYSYTFKGKTYEFIAPVGLTSEQCNAIANIDFKIKTRMKHLSEATQRKFTSLLGNNKVVNERLCNLLRSYYKDEAKLLSIISDEKLLNQKLNDIKELEAFFKPNDFAHLGGLLELKAANPARYQKIASSGIFELIKEGKLNAISLKKLGPNADLSPSIYKDLELLKQGKSIVPEFPIDTDLKTAFKQTEIGDAVAIGDKMYLNDGNSLVEWNMTKEKYLELFPPVERFAPVQGSVGNCHLIQSIGLAMVNPKARVQFLQSFSLKGNDVIVTVKGYEDYHGSHTFKNGEITLPTNGKNLTGCKGMQMYEQTYARVALRENYSVEYPNIAPVNEVMQRSASGMPSQTMADMFGKGHMIDVFPEKKVYNYETPKVGTTNSFSGRSSECLPYIEKGKTVKVDLNKQRNPKTKIYVFERFFMDFPDKAVGLRGLDVNTTETLLTHCSNNPDYLVSFGTTPKKGASAESSILAEYNLVSSHAYSILGYNKNTRMVQIGNPHAYGQVTEIPLETLNPYIQNLNFIKL